MVVIPGSLQYIDVPAEIICDGHLELSRAFGQDVHETEGWRSRCVWEGRNREAEPTKQFYTEIELATHTPRDRAREVPEAINLGHLGQALQMRLRTDGVKQ